MPATSRSGDDFVAALVGRPRRLALEIDDHDVVLGRSAPGRDGSRRGCGSSSRRSGATGGQVLDQPPRTSRRRREAARCSPRCDAAPASAVEARGRRARPGGGRRRRGASQVGVVEAARPRRPGRRSASRRRCASRRCAGRASRPSAGRARRPPRGDGASLSGGAAPACRSSRRRPSSVSVQASPWLRHEALQDARAPYGCPSGVDMLERAEQCRRVAEARDVSVRKRPTSTSGWMPGCRRR